MKLGVILKNTLENVKGIMVRFPVTMILLFILCIYAFASKHEFIDSRPWFEWFLIVGAFLSMALDNAHEIYKTKKVEWFVKGGAYAMHICLSILFYHALSGDASGNTTALLLRYSSIASAVFVSLICLPFVRHHENDIPLWHYLAKLMKAVGIASIFYLTFCLGVMLIMLSADYLFNIDVEEFFEIYLYGAILIFPSIFMAYLPEGKDQYDHTFPRDNALSFKFWRYMVFPLLTIFIAILYLYILSMMIGLELPRGKVSALVLTGFGVFLALLCGLDARRLSSEPNTDKKILKILSILMLPLLVLMSVGIGRRIADYGISIARMYLILVNLWAYAVCGILLLKNPRRLIWIPLSFVLGFMAVSVLPVVNISSVTTGVMYRSVMSHLRASGIDALPLDETQYDQWMRTLDAQTATDIESKLEYLRHHDTTSFLRILNQDFTYSWRHEIPQDDVEKGPRLKPVRITRSRYMHVCPVPQGVRGLIAEDTWVDAERDVKTGDVTFALSVEDGTGDDKVLHNFTFWGTQIEAEERSEEKNACLMLESDKSWLILYEFNFGPYEPRLSLEGILLFK